jgi:hypothetical protein
MQKHPANKTKPVLFQSKPRPKRIKKRGARNITKPNRSLGNKYPFIRALASLGNGGDLARFPLYNSIPQHVCKRKGVFTYPVNSSGNLYVEFTPSLLIGASSNATVATMGLMVLNHASYTDVNTTSLSLGTSGNITDLSMPATLGLDNDAFHSGVTIGFHVKVTATGVSTGNRAGMISMVQFFDDQKLLLTNTSTSTVNTYINSRPLKWQMQNAITLERDLSTAYTNSFEYTWIPNFNHNTIYGYEEDILTINSANIIDENIDYKKLGIYVNGANSATQLRLDVTVLYTATPVAQFLNQYPVAYGRDFQDYTAILQKISSDPSLVFHETEESGNHAYIGSVRQPRRQPLRNPK